MSLTNQRATPGKVPNGPIALVEEELMTYHVRSCQNFDQWKDVLKYISLDFQSKLSLANA